MQAVGDLYALPQEVLRAIRRAVAGDLFVQLDAPSQVSLFVYDNNKFIVESFRDNYTTVKLLLDNKFSKLRDVMTGQVLTGQPSQNVGFRSPTGPGQTMFEIMIGANAYRVFAAE